MCMISPAAVDKPVNIGGRIKFASTYQRFVLSTGTVAGSVFAWTWGRGMSSGEALDGGGL